MRGDLVSIVVSNANQTQYVQKDFPEGTAAATRAASHPIVDDLKANWPVILKKQDPKHTMLIVRMPTYRKDIERYADIYL